MNFLFSFVGLFVARLLWTRLFVGKDGNHAWYAFYYVGVFLFAVFLWRDQGPMAVGWGMCPIGTFDGLELFYSVQVGFYVSSLFFLVALEERRKDFLVLLGHHFVTLFLILTSYWMNWHRVGFQVMALHDLSDIFLYTFEFLRALTRRVSAFEPFARLVFSIFVLYFVVTRLLIFPTSIIYPCYLRVDQWGVEGKLALGGMLLLLGMHVYWTVQIGRAISRLRGKQSIAEVQDPREGEKKEN